MGVEILEDRVTPALLTPSQVTNAYGVNLINFGTAANPIIGNGAGQTIAILDPGDDAALVNTGSPNFSTSDLHNFDVLANLPDPPSFTVIGENGGARPSYVGILVSLEVGNRVTVTTSSPDGLSNGSSVTIAEDGAYDGTFSNVNVLTPTQFTYTDSAQTNLPGSSGGTINNPVSTGEVTLDVEWSHAMAPAANIVLIEMAGGITSGDLTNAVNTAVGPSVNASVVSMSVGFTGEYGGQTGTSTSSFDDGLFARSGTAFVAATGDNGAPGGYAAFSPNVLAVGATNLFLNGDGSYQAETGWSDPVITSATENGNTVTITSTAGFAKGGSVTIAGVGAAGYDGTFTVTSSNKNTFTYTDPISGLPPSSGGTATGNSGQNEGGSGGGISQFEPQPAYQQGTVTQVTQSTTNRTIPDVSFVGGGLTPVEIYNSDGSGGFYSPSNVGGVAGTSLSAPCWAGLIAIADQGLALQGRAPLNTSSTLQTENLQTDLYDLPLTDFHDITSGYNGFPAGPGYDLVTGIGTPVANLLIPDLAGRTPAVLAYSTPDNTPDHNLVVEEAGPNIDVFDNGTLVTSHPVSTTSQIDISGDDTSSTISLTVNYSGGVFDIPVNFNGGTGSGPHVLNIQNGSFSNETYTQTGANSGTITTDDSTINYSNVSSINDSPGLTPDTIQIDNLPGNVALTINTTVSQDTVYVNGLPSNSSVNVVTAMPQTEISSDAVYIGGANTLLPTLSAVLGTVAVQGVSVNGFFLDSVYFDDTAGLSNTTYQLSKTSLSRPGAGNYQFTGVGSVTLDTSQGTDLVEANGPTSFSWPTLNIVGALAPTTTLQVNGALATNYTITGGQMTIGVEASAGSNSFTINQFPDIINYSQVAKLELNLAATTSPNTVDVESTPSEASSTVIDDLAASAVVTVCQTSMNLDNITTPLTVDGNGNIALTVDDENNSNDFLTNDTITSTTLTRYAIDGFGHPHDASITYSGLGSLMLNTGDLPNFVNVESTAAPTTVNAGAGNVLVAVSPQAEDLDNLRGALTINGNGTEQLIVTDQNNPNSKTKYSLSGTTLTETGKLVINKRTFALTASITYSDVGSLVLDTANLPNQVTVQNTSVPTTINGGGGNNTYNVQATGASAVINTGSGNDSVNVGNSNMLDGIQAALTVTGQGGLDTLNFNDQASTDAQSYFVLSSIVYVRPFSLGVTYTGFAAVQLNGTQGAGTYNIQSTAGGTAYTIDAGKQDDTFIVAPFIENCDNCSTNLGLALNGGGGTNTLEVYDENNPNPGDYSVNAGVLYVRPLTSDITYSKISSLMLYGGQLGDTFNVYSTAGGTSYTLDGGSGGNTFDVGSFATNVLDNIQGAVTVNGQGNTSILNLDDQGSDGANTYTMTDSKVDRKGTSAITYSGLTSLVVNAGSGGNLITLSSTASGTSTTLNAGSGTGSNTIKMNANAVAYLGSLTISGQAGVNTLDYSGFSGPVTVDLPLGVATGVAGGISNILNVTGGAGDDLFVGNGQGNTLTGGTGRNMLIAGASPGTLMGGTSNKGTLMVGGTTNYDTNLVALDAIMSEWTGKGTYATRVNALLNGGGSNGNYLLGATEFTNNGGGNTLLGGSPGQDLYYGIEALDTNDWQPSLGEVFVQNPSEVSFQINAQALSEPLLFLDGGTPVLTQTPATFEVAPGVHTLSDPYAPGASVTFTVRADGTVTYQSSLDSVLGGQTTNTLIIHGAPITFNAQALSYPELRLDTVLADATAAPFTLNLLPGTHSFQEFYDSGSPINFNVGDNGAVSYAATYDGFLSGQGTSTLVINGLTITINAQALANSYFEMRIDTNLTDSPAAPFTLTLLPGPHTLADLFGQGSVQFSLGDNGTISYAASLDTVLSGQGTTTLLVNGAAVTIDAQALSDPELLFNNYTEQVSTAPFTVYLLPGTATLEELLQPNTSLTFSVAANGDVSYDPSLDSILSGQGTSTLVVNGVTITVNAQALSDPYLQVDTYLLETTAAPFALTVLPGTQTIDEYGEPGTAYNFMVAANGAVSYDPSLDSFLSGQGTSTLVVNGVTVTVNAQALSDPYLQIDTYIQGVETAAPFTLTVLPGTQTIQENGEDGSGLNFTVAANGTVSYDPSLDSILSGQGTSTLVVNGVTVTVNAHALSDPYLQINQYIPESTTAPFSLTVLPGTQTLAQYGEDGTGVYFTVAANGTVSYDPSLDTIFSGQGTSTLIVNGVSITVNATALSAPYLQIDTYIENDVTTATPFSLVLLPGTHTLQELEEAGTQVNFTVSDNGTVGYDSSLQGVLSGAGTNTLNVNGDTITINATALSDPYLQIDTYIFEPTAAPFTLTVLPGTHSLQEYLQSGTALNFMIADNGTVSYDSSLNGILSGQGTNTLVVNGETLIVNATAISSSVSSFTIGSFTTLSTAQVQTLQVLPGTVTFSDSTLQFSFSLLTTDQFSYPANVDSQVSGSGTNTLVILS